MRIKRRKTLSIFYIIFSIFFSTKINSQISKIPVYISGREGHDTYRIPAIIKAPNRHLLAFAEGRAANGGDFGDINIVLKRSINQGKNWSKLKIIVNNDSLQVGNPAPVVDYNDPKFPNGRIFLFYNTGNNHENEVRKGNGMREVWYKTSVDNGLNWSAAVNITGQVHRPNQPLFNRQYTFKDDWRSYANTPGHALQIQNGKYKGRIFVPANHSAGSPKADFTDYVSHGFYTDDHGKTFKLSPNLEIDGSNEATATEISSNRLMLNARNQKGNIKARIVAISADGGASWEKTYFDKNLPDPVCEGSILTIGKRNGKNVLAFSNAADSLNRDNLTLRISVDDGKTWKISKLIEQNKSKKDIDFTAYSDLVKINSNTVGILYERNDYKEIVYTAVKWE